MTTPEQQARELQDRLAVYRFVKLAAHQLRLRLHDRGEVWPAGSGVPRERPAQMQIDESE